MEFAMTVAGVTRFLGEARYPINHLEGQAPNCSAPASDLHARYHHGLVSSK